jgi:hypothetical protein
MPHQAPRAHIGRKFINGTNWCRPAIRRSQMKQARPGERHYPIVEAIQGTSKHFIFLERGYGLQDSMQRVRLRPYLRSKKRKRAAMNLVQRAVDCR